MLIKKKPIRNQTTTHTQTTKKPRNYKITKQQTTPGEIYAQHGDIFFCGGEVGR